MTKFLVTNRAPTSVIDEWMKTEPATRKREEEKMQGAWRQWMGEHRKLYADPGAGDGKTKRVTQQGTPDARNDVMLYPIVEAEAHDAAARNCEGHPHLQIPQVSIDVMEVNPLHGM